MNIGPTTIAKLLFCFSGILLSGCYRYVPTPDANKLEQQAKQLESRGDIVAACKLVADKSNRTAYNHKLHGECLERTSLTKKEQKEVEQAYKQAAECGSIEAKQRLLQMRLPAPQKIYAPGDTSNSLFEQGNPQLCGLEREVTPTGWAVAPVAVPAYLVAGTAAVGVAIAFVPFMILGGM